ncbi:MAG: redox-regulated ATPase YchF [Calditrichaeota bacterium]|nr:MAG: redox-regulated ATPase YchF [Calditrichota bacterium]
MEVGIIGLPYSGKSTLFSTLTGQAVPPTSGAGRVEVHRGVVQVPDPRLDALSEIFKPRKKVPATIEFLDVGGVESEKGRGGFDAQFLQILKNTDALCLVLRDFDNEYFPHPAGRIDPRADFQLVETEFLLSDLAIVENRLARLEKQLMKARDEQGQRELALLKRCAAQLEQEKPLRELSFTEEEEKQLKGFQFLTAKPLVVVINIDETKIQDAGRIEAAFADLAAQPGVVVVALCAKIEQEISQLEEAERKEFLQELGIEEPALPRMIRATYQLLGLISFFTVGEDECRAWTIRKGTPAQKAAGAIHSDLERGFIRAEVVHYDQFIKFKSLAACREKGLLRLEGKDYIVQDGDIITVRFNV